MPGGLGDPAPVRVAAVQRGLDERRVGDRARDALGLLGRRGPADLGAADAGRALAVGDDLERELEQHGVEQALGQRRARRRRWPAAARCRWCDICPSTVMRSKDGATAARSAASGSATAASVCTKQSIVAKPGSIIPAPFAWAETVTPPALHACTASGRGRWS